MERRGSVRRADLFRSGCTCGSGSGAAPFSTSFPLELLEGLSLLLELLESALLPNDFLLLGAR